MRIAEEIYRIGSGALGTGYSHPRNGNVYAIRCGTGYLLVNGLYPGHLLRTVRDARTQQGQANEPLERLLLPPNLTGL